MERGERNKVRREERIESERLARPDAFSMIERSMMEIRGATMTPALAALARSARKREGRFFVFHLLLGEVIVVVEPAVADAATGAEAGDVRARPWLGSFMVAKGEVGGKGERRKGGFGGCSGSRCHWRKSVGRKKT